MFYCAQRDGLPKSENTDCVGSVNVMEICGSTPVVLQIQSLYFNGSWVEYSVVIITNNIVIVVYSMCERRLVVPVVYLGVKTPGCGGY
jgi:hypothetical protein